jgi:UPF0271 protein
MPRINLNADLGESYGAWRMGNDAALLRVVSSANVACGYHAGDPLVMRETVRRAAALGVSVGAHPSYPDLQGFGRRRMAIEPGELEAMLIYQIGALQAIAVAEGTRVTHVKPHGALNNTACEDRGAADTVVRAMRAVEPSLILLAPALSELCRAGRDGGVPVVEEIFADRAYLDDGRLVPRSRPGAMVHGIEASLAHVERMLDAQGLVSLDGRTLPTAIGSVCVHGDGPEAVATAAALRERLQRRGYEVVPLTAL